MTPAFVDPFTFCRAMAPAGWLPPVAAVSRASPGSERPRSRSPGGKKMVAETLAFTNQQ